jgi:Cu/Ag efflux protein CusF
MLLYRRTVFAAAALLSLGGTASAQAPAPARIRGVVDSIDAHEMQVTTRAGQKVTMKLAADAGATFIAPIAIDAIRPGSFIGTAAVAQPDGTLKALEIQVFPEAMRGVGEGHRPWDLGEGSSMTNGTVGDLKVSNGRYLTLTYKGGEQKVFVPENAPIITYEKATLEDVKKGDHVIVTATHNPDETLTATRIGVGKNGLVPPM